MLFAVGVDRADMSLIARCLVLSSPFGLIPAVARQRSIPAGIGFHIPETETYTWVTFIDSLRPWDALEFILQNVDLLWT